MTLIEEFLQSKGNDYQLVYPQARKKEVEAWLDEYAQLYHANQIAQSPDGKISQSKQELLDCIEDLMGAFVNPHTRTLINTDFANKARENAREILEKNNRRYFL